jgi:hypothetical protein
MPHPTKINEAVLRAALTIPSYLEADADGRGGVGELHQDEFDFELIFYDAILIHSL